VSRPLSKQGKRKDLKGQFFRSSWEANVARWLNFHKIPWEYEPHRFVFSTIKRGPGKWYTPDFFIPDEGRYIEVKGYLDKLSATRLRRMAKYYPQTSIELVDTKRYKILDKEFKEKIPGWE